MEEFKKILASYLQTINGIFAPSKMPYAGSYTWCDEKEPEFILPDGQSAITTGKIAKLVNVNGPEIVISPDSATIVSICEAKPSNS